MEIPTIHLNGGFGWKLYTLEHSLKPLRLCKGNYIYHHHRHRHHGGPRHHRGRQVLTLISWPLHEPYVSVLSNTKT